jgi:hypothetical protein
MKSHGRSHAFLKRCTEHMKRKDGCMNGYGVGKGKLRGGRGYGGRGYGEGYGGRGNGKVTGRGGRGREQWKWGKGGRNSR